MQEEPTSADLLATARRVILEELVPALSGEARFKALMAANAIAIALREKPEAVAAAWERVGDPGEMVRRIRAGELDPGMAGSDEAYAALMGVALAQCAVSAPKAV